MIVNVGSRQKRPMRRREAGSQQRTPILDKVPDGALNCQGVCPFNSALCNMDVICTQVMGGAQLFVSRASGQFEGPVIVAMAAVRVVQMAIDEIIRVVAMRNRLMAAAGTVDMICGMAAALVVRGATVRICGGDFDHMLIDMVPVDMVEMAVVQIVNMPGMMDGDMAAIAAVLVAVVGMVGKCAGGHD